MNERTSGWMGVYGGQMGDSAGWSKRLSPTRRARLQRLPKPFRVSSHEHCLFDQAPQARRSGLSLAMQGTGNRSASCAYRPPSLTHTCKHVVMEAQEIGMASVLFV
eukprot:GHVU01097365.1.p1 GENE.GHVU01097365.1~~GHVU01097365.1.p1  ORF type:complete len:106 (+),score=0.82 GHVU01097365.1:121-438(+)